MPSHILQPFCKAPAQVSGKSTQTLEGRSSQLGHQPQGSVHGQAPLLQACCRLCNAQLQANPTALTNFLGPSRFSSLHGFSHLGLVVVNGSKQEKEGRCTLNKLSLNSCWMLQKQTAGNKEPISSGNTFCYSGIKLKGWIRGNQPKSWLLPASLHNSGRIFGQENALLHGRKLHRVKQCYP